MFSLMLRISNIWYLCEKSNLRYSLFYSELNLMLMLKLVNIKDLALIFKEPSPHKSFSSSCFMCKELQKNTQAKRIFWMKTLKYSSRTDSTDFDNSRVLLSENTIFHPPWNTYGHNGVQALFLKDHAKFNGSLFASVSEPGPLWVACVWSILLCSTNNS